VKNRMIAIKAISQVKPGNTEGQESSQNVTAWSSFWIVWMVGIELIRVLGQQLDQVEQLERRDRCLPGRR
jgi:hypothetical protein